MGTEETISISKWTELSVDKCRWSGEAGLHLSQGILCIGGGGGAQRLPKGLLGPIS